MGKIGQYGPYIGAAILLLVAVPIMFLGFVLAAAFANIGGGGGSGTTTAVNAGPITGCDTSSSFFDGLPAPSLGSSQIPQQFIPFYEQYAAKAGLGSCGAAILAATHSIECGSGGNGSCPDAHDGGVLGPMQFMQATWDGEIADPETKKGCSATSADILNVEKAICVAAFHDKHNGAPKDWRGALFLYNRADWYVDGVLALAKEIAGGAK